MADTRDLKSLDRNGREGSSPFFPTLLTILKIYIFMSTEKKTNRSLISTFILLGQMLFTSPKKNTDEIDFQPIAGALFDSEWDGFKYSVRYCDELVEQGFLTNEGNGKYTVTAYGQKMALQATHNTPNFNRVAEKGVSTSFAMMFASFGALKNFLNEQQRLESKQDSRLVDNIKELLEFFAAKLGLKLVPIEEPTNTKTKTKKTVVETIVE